MLVIVCITLAAFRSNVIRVLFRIKEESFSLSFEYLMQPSTSRRLVENFSSSSGLNVKDTNILVY